MLTRQRQLGGQITPGITLFPQFYNVITINDQSTRDNLSEEKKDEIETADQSDLYRNSSQFNGY